MIEMHVSSYLERLKIKLISLQLEERLYIANASEVLHSWGDMDLGERLDSHKPVGDWLRLSIMPYEEFVVWCYQHGIHAYYHEHDSAMVFVRVQIDRVRLDKLMQEIPPLYEKPDTSDFALMQGLIRQSIDLLRLIRANAVGRGLARIFISVVMLSYRLKIDLASQLFETLVSDKLDQIEANTKTDKVEPFSQERR